MPERLAKHGVRTVFDSNETWVIEIAADTSPGRQPLEQAEQAFPDIRFVTTNINQAAEAQTLRERVDTDAFESPELVIIDNGDIVDTHAGTMPAMEFHDWIEEQTGHPNTARYPSNNLP